ncbi:MAG TPA: SusC/RagA family TonB-linked outer membrane protein [Puia sp.]|nr:SusC/RagA family TonB-linked outer membrane protein [Puia sp.]
MNNLVHGGLRSLLLAAGVLLMLSVKAQDTEKLVSLHLKNVRLSDAVKEVRKQTDMNFFYSVDDLNKYPNVTIDVSGKRLVEVLDILLGGTDMQYSIEKNTVVIKRKTAASASVRSAADSTIHISGVVLSPGGSPLSGASVMDMVSGRSAITDANGKYALPVRHRAVLKITYIGMKPQQVTVRAEGTEAVTQNVRMQTAPAEMGEAVVTGYQTIRRSEMVGSANTVNRKDLFYDGTNTLEQMLQGKLPGVVISNQNGEIGTRQKVRVRGTSTLLSNQEPVWVVDGIIQEDPIPFNAQALNDLGNNFDMVRNYIGNGIAWLNPNDIEDVTVLKDAAATVLYGVKAANGVIVIKTKKGKQGRMSVNYSGGMAITERLNYDRLNLMNSKERIDVSREIYEQRLLGPRETTAVGYEHALDLYLNKQISYDEFNSMVRQMEVQNTDWMGILYRTPLNHNHSLSISGGTDKLTYYASVSGSERLGTAKGNDSRLLSASLNLDARLNDKITVSIRLNTNYTKTNGFFTTDPFTYAQETSRAIPAFDAQGKPAFYDLYNNGEYYKFNILNELAETGNTNDQRSYNGNVNLSYNILPGLRFESLFGATSTNAVGEAYASEYSYYVSSRFRHYQYGKYNVGDKEYQQSYLPHGGEFNSTENRNSTITWRNSLAYNKLWGRHRFGALVGEETRSVKQNGVSTRDFGYFPDRGRNITLPPRTINYNGVTPNPIYDSMGTVILDRLSNFLSYYGSLTYSYDERYVWTGSLRSDASNRFGQDKRHRFLPVWATGVRWNVHNEPWMQDQHWVSELNLRASYGWQGNVAENFGPDLIAQLPSRVVNPTTGEYELTIKTLPYADLRWEKTKTVNLGLDLGFAKNRFIMSLEYYHKRTEDMIIYKDIPVSYGTPSLPVNAGTMFNKGLELTVSGSLVRSKDFVWNMSLNTSRNSNSLNTQVENTNTWQTAAAGQWYKKGYAVTSFWVWPLQGLDPTNGYPIFHIPTKAENPNIENDPTTYLKYAGKLDPDFQAGISSTIRYKWLTLSTSFTWQQGGKKLLYKMFNLPEGQLPSAYSNLPREFANRWKQPGDEKKTNIPSIPSLMYYPAANNYYPPYMLGIPNGDPVGLEYVYDMYNYSDARVVSASFLRCNNISLTYNVPEKLLRNTLKNVSLTAAVANPFIIVSKDFKGMDPEVATGNQPIPRVYSAILNVSF